MNEVEALLRSAPTTEDGGEFVLFEGRSQFVGQFKTAEETAIYIKEHKMKRPTLLTLSMLNPKSNAYLDGVLYEW
jgi:arginine exporter protein ArgO